MNSIPLAFEPNVGQAGEGTKFIVRRPAITASFAADAIYLAFPGKSSHPERVGIAFDRSALVLGENELPGKTNYLRGNDPARWHTGIANFERIRYAQLWPGVDLIFYGNGEHLEHDFLVSPGADPQKITFNLRGVDSVETTPEGDLRVHLGDGLITFKKPVAYQETSSGRRLVDAHFKLNGTQAGFTLGAYDHRRALVIDPVLVFSTLLAGSTSESIGGLAVDAAGNVYVTGETNSADFPTTPASEQPVCNSCSGLAFDAFIAKLNPTGTALVYSTFIGGKDQDEAQAIAVDGSGNAIISGVTLSSDFPSVKAIGTFTCCDVWNMFVASLSANGSALNYSGIVGPLNTNSFDPNFFLQSSIFVPLAVDSAGNAYATTQTVYAAFPTTPSAIAPIPPSPQAAILVALKISPTGSLLYSTTIPGRAASGPPGNFGAPGPNTFSQTSIAVDATGSAYIAGRANDGLPTTLGVIGPAFASDSGFTVNFPQEGFLLKLNPAGSALTYATYVPGTSEVSALRVDSSNNAYLGGITSSASLPVSATGFQKDPGCAGCQASFLLKVNPQATAVLAGTYLRGAPRALSDTASLAHIALDSSNDVLVTGLDSAAANFPMKNPLEQLLGGFIIELSNDLSTLLFASGGPDALIEVAPSGKIILAGNSGFPPTPGAFQTAPPLAREDLFSLPNVAAIDLTVPAPALCINQRLLNFGSGVVAPGTTSAPQSSILTNCGNADLHVSSVASDSPDYAVTTTCPLSPAAIAVGSTCTVSATYSPVDYATGNVVIKDDALLSPHTVSLVGFPKAPATAFDPTSLTFLETPVTTSIGLPLDVINSGFTPLTISSTTTTGDFSVTQSCAGVTVPVFVFVPPLGGPRNNLCHLLVSFSPTNTGTRTGTLIVKDNSLDSPHVVQLSGVGLGAWPTPAVVSGSAVNVAGTAGQVDNSPGKAQVLPLTGGGFSRLTTATVDGLIFDNNNRVIKIVGPQELDLTLADNDFADVGEVPVTATTPAPGGGTSTSVATISAPVKFYDPLFRQITFLGGSNLVVGPKSGLIYEPLGNNWIRASTSSFNLATIAVVDPEIQRLNNGLVSFPHSATTLAVSDDEQFLYAAFADNNTVAQISLPGGAINFMASLGKDPALGNYNATALRVMPGHPHTWVAALQPLFDTKPIALKVFDDGVPRANTVEQGNATSTFPGKLLFIGNDTSTVYSIDSTSLYRFTIDANGVTLKDKTAGLGAEDFATDGALLYLSTGAIIDPTTLITVGNFALAPGLATHAMVVDAGTSRAIFAGDGPAIPTATTLGAAPTFIQAFNTQTLASAGSFNMPVASMGASLLRWGTNGLASGLTLTRSSLTGNSGLLAPFHIGANGGQGPLGAIQVRQGQPAAYHVGIVGINGFNGPITFSCSNLPQFASCSFSQNPVSAGGQLVITISTHQATTASAAPARLPVRFGTGFVVLAGLLSLPFALAFAGRRYRGKWLTICLLLAMAGCGGGSGSAGGGGGGGGGGTPTPTPTPTATGGNTPIGNYDIILTGTSASGTRHAVLQLLVVG